MNPCDTRSLWPALLALCAVGLAAPLGAQDAGSAQAPTANAFELPVKELTAFKDGHAYVLREAPLPEDANGRVVLDELPTPVLGTFWPFAHGGASLVSAKAGREDVTVKVKVATLLHVAKANIGKTVTLDVGKGEVVGGKLVAVPEQPGSTALLLVRDGKGTRAVPIERVRDIIVDGAFTDVIERKQERERLELRVNGGGDNAKVGVIYVQKGFSWIPSYHVELDGDGKATVKMQATLVNDLIDLEDATVNLVVGVPKFAFEGMVDPIALHRQTPQVANAGGYNQQAFFANGLSNSLTTQVAGYSFGNQQPQQDPKVDSGEASEDLFVFPVSHVTLKKGERLVVLITSFEVSYRDVYRFDSAMAPPMEHRKNLQDQRIFELARQLAAPKVRHILRLKNSSVMPFTTAPALVFSRGRILAQGHMKYTSRGAFTDLEINQAIDVRVETEEKETGRTTNVRLSGDNYTRVELGGTIKLVNGKQVPVEIEVVRRVLGLVDEVDNDGKSAQLDLVHAWGSTNRPEWWSWWSWPYWWFHHNGFGECQWTVTLKPGEKIELGAKWHYFWR